MAPAVMDLVAVSLGQIPRCLNFLGWAPARPVSEQPAVRVGVLGASSVAQYALVWPGRGGPGAARRTVDASWHPVHAAAKSLACAANRVEGVKVTAVAARDVKRATIYAKQNRWAPVRQAVAPSLLHFVWAAAGTCAHI